MTRNSKTLASFVKYCKEHPYERFWQALRNWSGYHFILAGNWAGVVGITKEEHDTFNWEGRRDDDSVA